MWYPIRMGIEYAEKGKDNAIVGWTAVGLGRQSTEYLRIAHRIRYLLGTIYYRVTR